MTLEVALSDHLVAIDESRFDQKTKRYRLRNSQNGSELGLVKFEGAWRQYVFHPEPDTFHNHACLTAIAAFLQQLTNSWRSQT